MRTTTIIYKHFVGCTSSDDVKKRYRSLAMTHHPDRGGNEATFKEMVAEYSYLTENVAMITFPVSNIKGTSNRPTSNGADAFWEAMNSDTYTKSSHNVYEDLHKKQRSPGSQEDNRYKILEYVEPVFIFLNELVTNACLTGQTGHALLMDVFKLDDLGMDHFKYIRWKVAKVSGGKNKLKEDWVNTSYKNYIAVKQIKWE